VFQLSVELCAPTTSSQSAPAFDRLITGGGGGGGLTFVVGGAASWSKNRAQCEKTPAWKQ